MNRHCNVIEVLFGGIWWRQNI